MTGPCWDFLHNVVFPVGISICIFAGCVAILISLWMFVKTVLELSKEE